MERKNRCSTQVSLQSNAFIGVYYVTHAESVSLLPELELRLSGSQTSALPTEIHRLSYLYYKLIFFINFNL